MALSCGPALDATALDETGSGYADECGPSDKFPAEPSCRLEDLRTSLELRVDDEPCDPCLAVDNPLLWTTMETDCRDAVEWEESCLILFDHIAWRLPGESERSGAFFTYCPDVIGRWTVTPDEPLMWRAPQQPLSELIGQPITPGIYEFEAYFVRRKIAPAFVSVVIE